MGKRKEIDFKHKPEELREAYANTKDLVAKQQYQVMYLLAEEYSYKEVMKITGYSRAMVYQIITKYEKGGLEGLTDQRKHNFKPPKLTQEHCEAIDTYLKEAMAEGHVVTSKEVTAFVKETFKIEMSSTTVYRCMRKLGWRQTKPRPQHVKRDVAEGETFKKTLTTPWTNFVRSIPG